MAKTSYAVDETMQRNIEEMRTELGAENNGEVVRRAIALMKLALTSSTEDKKIDLLDARAGVLQRVSLK